MLWRSIVAMPARNVRRLAAVPATRCAGSTMDGVGVKYIDDSGDSLFRSDVRPGAHAFAKRSRVARLLSTSEFNGTCVAAIWEVATYRMSRRLPVVRTVTERPQTDKNGRCFRLAAIATLAHLGPAGSGGDPGRSSMALQGLCDPIVRAKRRGGRPKFSQMKPRCHTSKNCSLDSKRASGTRSGPNDRALRSGSGQRAGQSMPVLKDASDSATFRSPGGGFDRVEIRARIRSVRSVSSLTTTKSCRTMSAHGTGRAKCEAVDDRRYSDFLDFGLPPDLSNDFWFGF